MILMWLGSFVLLMFGLKEVQKTFFSMCAGFEKNLLDRTANIKTAFILSVLGASPQQSVRRGVDWCEREGAGIKGGVLLMCLSPLGSWLALSLALLFLNFNGFFLLGFCLIGFLKISEKPQLQNFLKGLFAVGAFLVGGEMMLRNSSIMQTILGQSEFAFFLADGRFIQVISILVGSLVLSLFMNLEFWSLGLSLGLLSINALSVNGALGMIVGELVSGSLLVWWQSRGLGLGVKNLTKRFAVISALGVLIGFLIVGEARSAFYFAVSSDMSSLQYKTFQFVILLAIIFFVQWVFLMTWGHFASRGTKAQSS